MHATAYGKAVKMESYTQEKGTRVCTHKHTQAEVTRKMKKISTSLSHLSLLPNWWSFDFPIHPVSPFQTPLSFFPFPPHASLPLSPPVHGVRHFCHSLVFRKGRQARNPVRARAGVVAVVASSLPQATAATAASPPSCPAAFAAVFNVTVAPVAAAAAGLSKANESGATVRRMTQRKL